MGQGGVQRIIFQLCKGNKDIPQCVASSGGYYVNELNRLDINHYLIDDIEIKNPITILRTIKKLNHIINKERISIVHTHHRMAAFYGRLLIIRNRKLEHIYTSHNVFHNKRFFTRFALKNAKIVAVGKGVRDNLSTKFGIPSEQITVIRNAIDTTEKGGELNQTIENLKKDGKYIIGAIGRLSKQKGFDVLLHAIKIVVTECPHVYLVIVGDGKERESLKKLIFDLDINDFVLLLGYQKDVLCIINQFEFIVAPSRWEGFPLTPIEAFSQRKTVITTNIPGNNELIIDNVNGLLIDVDDYKDLANKIVLLVNNFDLKDEMCKRAFDAYINRFDYEIFLKEYRKVYGL